MNAKQLALQAGYAKAPANKRQQSWTDYREAWDNLIKNGFEPKQAARWVADKMGWDAEDEGKFYRAAKQWK